MSDNATITIVSGLPRSGTSLMMQMLEKGGMQVATDGRRQADEDNPRGYYEVEDVKRLQTDASWIPEMRGQALKVISQLLFSLPSTEKYQVLFMQRDLEEVLASQAAMLARSGKAGAGSVEMLRKAFTAHLQKLESWLPQQEHIELLRLPYAEVVSEPEQAAEQVAGFLGVELNTEAMASAVDVGLYRNRGGGQQ